MFKLHHYQAFRWNGRVERTAEVPDGSAGGGRARLRPVFRRGNGSFRAPTIENRAAESDARLGSGSDSCSCNWFTVPADSQHARPIFRYQRPHSCRNCSTSSIPCIAILLVGIANSFREGLATTTRPPLSS